ncbi:MAG: IS982 family transposase, partial [Wolbachia sp.]
MNKNITELFCFADDCCKIIDGNFASKLLPNGEKPTRVPEITHSEIITIILLYHQ